MAPSAAEPPMRLLSLNDDAPLESPFPPLESDLTEDDLRETAYEIFVAACGHNALSARTQVHKRSGFSSVASKVTKKALALGSKRDRIVHPASKGKKPPTTAEIVQYQMRINEGSEERIRAGLLSAFLKQVGKPVECMLVPLELLQSVRPDQFMNSHEFDKWRKRQLRVLEAGLINYPAVRQEGADKTLTQRLQIMISEMEDSPVETGKSSESLSALRIAAIAKAGRSVSGEQVHAVHLHWADGYPLNVRLYMTLLSSNFDALDEGQLIEEVDEVLDMMKKTWGILGINQMLHSLCFMWVLFNQFVVTGQLDIQLLELAEEYLKEFAKESKRNVVVQGAPAFKTALTTINSWAERRLLAYHEIYPKGANGVMKAVLSLGLSAGRYLAETAQQESQRKPKDLSNFESDKVELYIRSSLKAAFAQMMETAENKRRSFKGAPRATLTVLAADIGQLAEEETVNFSPVLKEWNVCSGGIAAATLHACFAREIKEFQEKRTNGIGADVLQVLQAADQLEKDLVQIAVLDAVDADDGGKGLMREMQPYECEAIIEKLSKEWLQNALAHLIEWVGRNIQNEEWKANGTREGYAPSAVEVLRIIEETLEAFFVLPISKNPLYVEQVTSGVESAVQLYCDKTVSACGKKERYVPSLPSLTRYDKAAFKQKGGWRQGFGFQKSKIGSQVGASSNERSSDLENICVRINTLHHLSTELQYIAKRLRYGWHKDAPSRTEPKDHSIKGIGGLGGHGSFKDVEHELDNGVQFLIELCAYRVVFYDLHGVFWEGLYAGGVEGARITPVIEQLEQKLETIAKIADENLRNRIVGALMKACMDCLVLVLVAGGPSRAFTIADAVILEEDLLNLIDLFTAEGDGLPEELVGGATDQIRHVLELFHVSTEKLIPRFRDAYPGADEGSSSRFKSAVVPRTTGNWSPTDANTIFRVLCYRGDDQASKYLKKTFNLPKKSALLK